MKLHYTNLSNFSRGYYKGFIGKQHLKEEVAIKGEKYWLAEVNKQKFLLTDSVVEALPIVVVEYEPLLYRNKVYNIPTKVKSVKLKPEKKMSFRDLVDWFELKMSEYDLDGNRLTVEQYDKSKLQHLLYRIIVMAAEIDRINFRISTTAGFGKNSMVSMLGALMGDVAESNPRSAPAIEYRLFNKLLVLDELSNLESSQKQLIQNILLQIGDFSPSYEKGTRATTDTADIYDISNLSLLIFYNLYEDYVLAGQEQRFFDNVFTKAVMDRFPAVRFYGFLDQNQFLEEPNKDDWVKYADEYKAVISTIRWYRENWVDELTDEKYDWVKETLMNKRLYGNRHRKSLYKVLSFLAVYSLGYEEYTQLSEELFKAYWDYKEALSKNSKSVATTVEEIKIDSFI